MNSGFRFSPWGREKLLHLDDAYGAPEAMLGNQPDAVDEAVHIILSFQTDLARFKEAWRSLRSAFPRWEDSDRASANEIAEVLRLGGRYRQKAKAIKQLLRAVHVRFGKLSLAALRELPDADAERVLTRLSGLSWTGARCVLLYGLQRDVFPVDGRTFRILQRAGVIPGAAVYPRSPLHDVLQAAVPPEGRRPFHVNLAVNGQRACLPRTPPCESRSVLGSCQRRGLGALAAQPQGGAGSGVKHGAGSSTAQSTERSSRDAAPALAGRRRSPEPEVQHAATAR